jgi:hypothetical protein
MSDNGYKIRVDDLILFFRALDKDKNETIVNRLIPHNVYTADSRKVQVDGGCKDAVLSEPTVPSDENHHYYVANLAKLLLPDGAPPEDTEPLPRDFWSGAKPPGEFAAGDLVVFPPDQAASWFHIPRTVIDEKCRQLSASDISDLEFMAGEEGAVIANVPKVVPQGCTCILLSLVGLRSGMLKETVHQAVQDKATKATKATGKTAEGTAPAPRTIEIKGHDTKQYVDKSEYAKLVPGLMREGHRR